MSVFTWSTTAANNGTADSSINWSEGQAPSTVNDSARAMMAALARYFGDISGAITTGGTTTAYTLTTNSGFDTLAHMGGQMLAFVPNQTNAAGSPSVTLAVDGLTAKPIRFSPNVEIPSNTLILGTPYVVTYNNSDGAFYTQGFGTNPYQIPLGAMLPYTGATAPNSAFILPFGQVLSQTTYATYFSLVSTTYNTGGEGGGNFRAPDLRGRVPIGLDNMGGSAANRVTTLTNGPTGTTIGSTGGTQAMLQTALPNVQLNVNNNINANNLILSNSGGTGAPAAVTAFSTALGSSSLANTYSFATVSINTGVTQTSNLPPSIIVPYILRVL